LDVHPKKPSKEEGVLDILSMCNLTFFSINLSREKKKGVKPRENKHVTFYFFIFKSFGLT
jgi:hypothetical protein